MRDGREQLELMNLLAHDLKNPMGAALANLGFAEGAETTDPELPGALRDAPTAVKRVLQIVDNMTVASQHQAGELTVAKDPVVLRDVLEALVSAPAEDRTTVVVACPPDLCASADAELLRRALEALLEASTRWVGSRGKLLLGARKDGERVLVFVAHDLPFEREPRLAALASDG